MTITFDGTNVKLHWVGKAPTWEIFVRALWSCGLLEPDLAWDRQNPGTLLVSEGLSGRKDFFWRECQKSGDRLIPIRDHHILHISCEGKLNEGLRCYYLDLLDVIREMGAPELKEEDRLPFKDFSDKTYTWVKDDCDKWVAKLDPECSIPGEHFRLRWDEPVPMTKPERRLRSRRGAMSGLFYNDRTGEFESR